MAKTYSPSEDSDLTEVVARCIDNGIPAHELQGAIKEAWIEYIDERVTEDIKTLSETADIQRRAAVDAFGPRFRFSPEEPENLTEVGMEGSSKETVDRVEAQATYPEPPDADADDWTAWAVWLQWLVLTFMEREGYDPPCAAMALGVSWDVLRLILKGNYIPHENIITRLSDKLPGIVGRFTTLKQVRMTYVKIEGQSKRGD